jgi:hypothetical protein
MLTQPEEQDLEIHRLPSPSGLNAPGWLITMLFLAPGFFLSLVFIAPAYAHVIGGIGITMEYLIYAFIALQQILTLACAWMATKIDGDLLSKPPQERNKHMIIRIFIFWLMQFIISPLAATLFFVTFRMMNQMSNP